MPISTVGSFASRIGGLVGAPPCEGSPAPGPRVAAGAPLFTLDASLVRAEVREWQATRDKSQRDAKRADELSAQKLISQQDVDAKRSELAVNDARLSSAKTRLAKTTITAPFEGVVGLRQVSPGEYVEAGQALVDLVQLDPLKLEFRVPEIHLACRTNAEGALNGRLATGAAPGETAGGTGHGSFSNASRSAAVCSGTPTKATRRTCRSSSTSFRPKKSGPRMRSHSTTLRSCTA